MATVINLSWPANPAVQGVSSYLVYQSVDNGAFALIATVPANANPSHSIGGPLPGKYRWKVLARSFVGDSPFGNVAEGPDVPTAPGDITVTIVNS